MLLAMHIRIKQQNNVGHIFLRKSEGVYLVELTVDRRVVVIILPLSRASLALEGRAVTVGQGSTGYSIYLNAELLEAIPKAALTDAQ